MSICNHGINIKHRRCYTCEEIALAEMGVRSAAKGIENHESEVFSIPTQICKVAKADVQQLKSVRDDLANRFKENDKLLQGETNRPTKQRLERKIGKLTGQITAINRLIKHLETQLK